MVRGVEGRARRRGVRRVRVRGFIIGRCGVVVIMERVANVWELGPACACRRMESRLVDLLPTRGTVVL